MDIHVRFIQGQSIRKIARELGISRNTVKHHLQQQQMPTYCGRKAMRYVVNYLAKAEQKPFDPIYHISRLPDVNDKPIGRPRSRQR
ncbi:sigma factor-like helix-turn-helix DNA-binding protein [Providencia manganoxydans]